MSRVLHWIVIGGNFLWKAAGVPPAQRAMIISDHLDQGGLNPFTVNLNDNNGEAMWEYIENTLGPVAQETLISDDNFYYLLALQGKYSRRWADQVGANWPELTDYQTDATHRTYQRRLMQSCPGQVHLTVFVYIPTRSMKLSPASHQER